MRSFPLVQLLFAAFLFVGCNQTSAPTNDLDNARDNAVGSDEPAATDAPPDIDARDPVVAEADEPSEKGSDSSNVVELEAITFTAPEAWQRKEQSSSFVVAEFALPGTEGDDADGRLTISTAGGSLQANIDRWKDQFGGDPENATQEEIDVGGVKATLVDFSGDFSDQRGPFAPAVTRKDYRMVAAILPIDGELHFVKATGPRKTIEAHADEIKQFVASAQLKQ
jgi:hypothetical protein